MHPSGDSLPLRTDARAKYEIDQSVYPPGADLSAARVLAQRLNRVRDLSSNPGIAVKVGELSASALIDEIMAHVVGLYLKQNGESLLDEAARTAAGRIGKDDFDACLAQYEHLFETADSRDLRQLILLWLKNENRACKPFAELFHDTELRDGTAYADLIADLDEFFAHQPGFGPDDEPLLAMLGTPARIFPDSLERQLSYIRDRWGSMLGDFLFRLLRGLDYLREDRKAGFAGPGPTRVYSFEGMDPERFSPDRDWMPNVVLLAKSTLVWLDQLSKTYKESIHRLDQIPDAELDRIASTGINALWLIGLWERSAASRRIKHISGNPEAEASAYALYEYEIAGRLGGWDALVSLRERCERRGIRLASDMVPNHTGIDGRWVIEHPEWFIQSDHPPFPGYSFTGEDLSPVESVGIRLEDHYYDRSDAAVVFQRTDYATGQNRYIYHGNDGTSMPWNDTAQLDFLKPEVREAVIRTILHVARNFPIIRFDAAMTLARKHIRRLWFPEPGQGGDIASRSERGLTADQFDQAMPHEFWREVVDRAAVEAPDTLLLAEAFWMMEGYFVRTLGMHRVYNSAFMNMLKNEENAKYRQTIRNTIEFDKEILKRFVNFMNNPDEDTAVAQFGTGDKYFGVCTLMITMPGLPMIGHGQIEGFSEKYGMEYSRAYHDETPDERIVTRHEREIFPLIRRRHLFSSVESFLLYDLYSDAGVVNENVFAYSNENSGEKTLVLYNNAFDRAWGWISESAAYVEKVNGKKEQRRRHIAHAFGLHKEAGYFCLFNDVASGRWFIRRSVDLHEKGLYVNLSGYQAQVFVGLHEVADDESFHYAQLHDELGGRGVENVGDALREIVLRPVLDTFSGLANSQVYAEIGAALSGGRPLATASTTKLASDYARFLRTGAEFKDADGETDRAVEDLAKLLGSAGTAAFYDLKKPNERRLELRRAITAFSQPLKDNAVLRDTLTTWILVAPLGEVYRRAAGVCDEWSLDIRAVRAFSQPPPDDSWALLLRILLTNRGWAELHATAGSLLAAITHDSEATAYLQFNEYEGTVWFNRERYDSLVWGLYAIAALDACSSTGKTGCPELADLHAIFVDLDAAATKSGYDVAKLMEAAGVEPSGKKT